MLSNISPQNSRITGIERRNSCLFLTSEAGTHRIMPKNSHTLRVTFTKEKDFSAAPRPGITEPESVFDDWNHTENCSEIILATSEITVKINRETASYSYFDHCGKRLLKEIEYDSHTLEKFDVYEIANACVTKVQTADGVKDVVREADSVKIGYSYHGRLNLEFQDGEEIYGLGQHEEAFGTMRGQTVYLHQANRKIAVPLFVSNRGYGILTDTYSPMIFSDTPYGSYIYSEAVPELDFYFMFGGNMRGVIKEYRQITGKASMLPRWAFGYIQSKEKYDTQEEMENIVEEYRKRSIGLDCVVLDWCSWEEGKWGQKTFDSSRFPEPNKMIERLHEKHVRFMISIWANTDENTENHAEFKNSGLLLPNCGIYNALTKEGRKLYWKQAKCGLFDNSVDAWWCDNSEPITPEWNHLERVEPAKMYEEYCNHVQNHIPLEQSNAFGLYHSLGIYEGQRSVTDKKRVVNLTRSSYTGQQRYGTILWSGDISASWGTLKRQISSGLNFCASGQPYWTTDIGAFFVKRGEPWYWRGEFEKCFDDLGYRELFTRWYQWGTFLPIFRVHGTDCRRELWNCENADVCFYDAIIKTNRLRYELMPYIYSAAGKCSINDDSMILPLAADYPDDKTALKIVDQYMFGDSLMVCPVTEPMYYKSNSEKVNSQKTRQVYLPEGGWYDFYTKEYHTGGRWITANAPIDIIPLYVREGSVIPMCEFAQSTDELSENIILNVYTGRDAVYTLYEDAFDGYGYEKGEYIMTDFIWNDKEKVLGTEVHTAWDLSSEEKTKRYRVIKINIIRKS